MDSLPGLLIYSLTFLQVMVNILWVSKLTFQPVDGLFRFLSTAGVLAFTFVTVTGKRGSNYWLPLSCNRKRQKV